MEEHSTWDVVQLQRTEELASSYREVQRKVEVQQKKLLLMEGQILVKQQETLTPVEVAANHQERDYVTDKQR